MSEEDRPSYKKGDFEVSPFDNGVDDNRYPSRPRGWTVDIYYSSEYGQLEFEIPYKEMKKIMDYIEKRLKEDGTRG